jgi:endonuclease/exonuclease/phosphatase (EEP) superfamily protein YafD
MTEAQAIPPIRRSRRLPIAISCAGIMATALVLASMFDTRVWWLELPGHFRWQVAVLLAIVGFAMAIAARRHSFRRWWMPIAVAALSFLVSAFEIVRSSTNNWNPVGPTGLGDTKIRVIHFNLGVREGGWADVIHWLESQPVDVIFLQEARPSFAAEFESSPLASKIVLRNVRPDSRGTIAIVTGNATLVRARLDTDLFAKTGRELAEIEIECQGDRRTFLSVHMCRPTDAKEFAKQSYELDRLADWFGKDGNRRVAIGDINCTPYSPRFAAMQRRTGTRAANVGTWPAVLPSSVGIAIDALLVGQFDGIEDAHAGPDLGSDHRPLIATIRLSS